MFKVKFWSIRSKIVLLTFISILVLQISATIIQYVQIRQSLFDNMVSKANNSSQDITNGLIKRLAVLSNEEDRAKFVQIYIKLEANVIFGQILSKVDELEKIQFLTGDGLSLLERDRVSQSIDGQSNKVKASIANLVLKKQVAILEEDSNFIILIPVKDNGSILGYLVFYYSNSALLAQEAILIISNLIFLLVFLIIGALLSIFFSNKITKPLIELRESAEKLGQGNLNIHVKAQTNDEVGDLANTFNGMADSLRKLDTENKKAQNNAKIHAVELERTQKTLLQTVNDLNLEKAKLEEAKTKDEALLSSIAEGVIAVDGEGKIILINNAAEEVIGLKKGESLGKKWFEVLVREDEYGVHLPPETGAIQLALSGAKTTIANSYYNRKNGTRFPVAVAVSPVFFNNKVAGAINVFRDITKEKELDEAKNEFISLASHQLRTPLAAIKWVLELFKQDKGLTTQHKKRLEEIYTSNERIINLVNNLLSVARIESGRTRVEKKKVDIRQLIDDCCRSSQIYADKKGQKIKVIAEVKNKNVSLDPMFFQEAVSNIINNAISYGSDNSVILVMVSAEKKECLISIHNEGSFISKSDYEKIFTKFYRGVDAQNIKLAGTGLGLYITKMAVLANGGKIWFESGVKKGTTFYFTIPLK
ncbi:MAG: ATP-binding protein [bacterium]